MLLKKSVRYLGFWGYILFFYYIRIIENHIFFPGSPVFLRLFTVFPGFLDLALATALSAAAELV
jgi:hypothetical protein